MSWVNVMVNEETGEVRDFTKFKRQSTAFAARQDRLGKSHDFTFTHMENIEKVIGNIDEKHCGYLLYLQCFINYDGVLTQPSRSKAPMTKADIQATVGLKRTAFNDFFRNMTDNGIIYEQDERFHVNPAYHFKGALEMTNVIRSFTAKVRELFNGRNAKKLGFVYKLLPYVHYETNSLCVNPYEKDVERVRQFSKAQIAEVTGTSEKTVYTYLRTMKLGDEFVFAEIRSGKECFYKLNPFIFYRKNGRPDATLREIFRRGFN